MAMDERLVMPVGVTSRSELILGVVMVAVAMLVFVVVNHGFVSVPMFVTGRQRNADTDCCRCRRCELRRGDALAQEQPSDAGADERGRGEDDLAPRRSQLSGSADP
jgi:hypothetical protein